MFPRVILLLCLVVCLSPRLLRAQEALDRLDAALSLSLL